MQSTTTTSGAKLVRLGEDVVPRPGTGQRRHQPFFQGVLESQPRRPGRHRGVGRELDAGGGRARRHGLPAQEPDLVALADQPGTEVERRRGVAAAVPAHDQEPAGPAHRAGLMFWLQSPPGMASSR